MNAASLSIEPRGRFEGVINILRFNWPLYLRALGVVLSMGALVLAFNLPTAIKELDLVAILAGIFYLVFSLVVSHWIYDRSPLYDLSWLDRAFPLNAGQIINLTAGFDETTLRLKNKYPGATVATLDFYDPRVHTEPSISRARAFQPPLPETIQVSSDQLHIKPASIDLALGILALHEIRLPREREVLFQSIGDALYTHGRCVVVEHLRDLPNFLAFGPGFLHFFSRRAWIKAAQTRDLRLVDEFKITPFLRVFVLEKI